LLGERAAQLKMEASGAQKNNAAAKARVARDRLTHPAAAVAVAIW
jgi:hypothetical protein